MTSIPKPGRALGWQKLKLVTFYMMVKFWLERSKPPYKHQLHEYITEEIEKGRLKPLWTSKKMPSERLMNKYIYELSGEGLFEENHEKISRGKSVITYLPTVEAEEIYYNIEEQLTSKKAIFLDKYSEYGKIVERFKNTLEDILGFGQTHIGRYQTLIICYLASENNPVERLELRDLLTKRIRGFKPEFLNEAINGLVANRILVSCQECLTRLNCPYVGDKVAIQEIKEIPKHLRSMLKDPWKENLTEDLQENLVNDLHAITEEQHLLNGGWNLIPNGVMPLKSQKFFLGEGAQRRMREKIIQMLSKTESTLDIISEYATWLRGQPELSIVEKKAKERVRVRVILVSEPCGNGRIEWNESYNLLSQTLKKACKIYSTTPERHGLHMTIADSKCAFVLERRLGTRLVGPRYTEYPKDIQFLKKRFEELLKRPETKLIWPIPST